MFGRVESTSITRLPMNPWRGPALSSELLRASKLYSTINGCLKIDKMFVERAEDFPRDAAPGLPGVLGPASCLVPRSYMLVLKAQNTVRLTSFAEIQHELSKNHGC